MRVELSDPNVLGLAYDAVGILIFGVPALLVDSMRIAKEGGTTWDYNKFTFLRFIEQKWDTCVGSVFLMAGFVFQAIAALGWYFVWPAGLVLWLALPVLALSYVSARGRIFDWQLKNVMAIATKS
jgi:hypothetical protein